MWNIFITVVPQIGGRFNNNRTRIFSTFEIMNGRNNEIITHPCARVVHI